MRRSLPVVLALLLALFAGANVAPAGADHAHRGEVASSAARTSEAPTPNVASATFEPTAASFDAVLCCVVADRERVLHTQLVTTVRAARAPPLTLI
jgi:hypothetical protein